MLANTLAGEAADLLAHADGFGILALDLAGVPARQARRISLASWCRLRHAVKDTPTAIIVVEAELNAPSCSTLHIEHQPIRSETRCCGACRERHNRTASVVAAVRC